VIRQALPQDIPIILELIRELAEYEKLLEECIASEEQLEVALFGDNPKVFSKVAEIEGDIVGFCLYFLNFSTFLGKHGMYLEDLYVKPEFRGSGIGKALLLDLAKECETKGYGRFEWSVLDWNEPSIGFYKSLGAVPMDDWTVFRVAGDHLKALATK
jgi:GNAT superfamily N-acetyltransferase